MVVFPTLESYTFDSNGIKFLWSYMFSISKWFKIRKNFLLFQNCLFQAKNAYSVQEAKGFSKASGLL